MMRQITLLSKRLRLRLIELSDLNAIHQLHSLPETDRFNTLGIPKSIEETQKIITAWVEENHMANIRNYTFAVEKIEHKVFIGLIALKLGNEKYKNGEVWYKLNSNVWGNGYATESLKKLIRFGFDELKLHRIEAGCAVGNIGSIRVLEKAGMTREGHKRKVLPLKSGWSDNYEYAILETDEKNI